MFHLLPEWDPQRAILINWPHRYAHDWDSIREPVDNIYLNLVKMVAMTQSLMVICYDIEQRNQIQRRLIEANVNLPRIRFFIIPSDDVWTRDYGPLTLRHQNQTKILNFKFNGWGDKYPALQDNLVASQLHNQSFFPQAQFNQINFVLEGGSIETDGAGSLLTTRSCLLSKNRNPDYNQNQIEDLLKKHLGQQQILWLDHGYLQGNDTDGHIDELARFINPQTIGYTQCTEIGDEHFESLAAMENQLQQFKNVQGQPYHLVPLPLPQPIYSLANGERLPATYTKFMITNHLVLLPIYEVPQDEVAKNMLQSCFPTREVKGIPSRSLLENYGSLHGIAMQIPI